MVATSFVACGSGQKTPRDLCLIAVKRGPPPADPVCPEGTEPASALTPPSRASRIPGPGRTQNEPAERRWCATSDGSLRGPYVALDRAGRVVESGQHGVSGKRDGPWIIWSGMAPRAVGMYRSGESLALESCVLSKPIARKRREW